MEVHAPPNTQMVTEMWAYLSVDPTNGFEGVIAAPGPGGLMLPLVGADGARMQSYRPLVEKLAQQLKIEIRLVKFTTKEVVATIKGE